VLDLLAFTFLAKGTDTALVQQKFRSLKPALESKDDGLRGEGGGLNWVKESDFLIRSPNRVYLFLFLT
jgi:hypothetical protein